MLTVISTLSICMVCCTWLKSFFCCFTRSSSFSLLARHWSLSLDNCKGKIIKDESMSNLEFANDVKTFTTCSLIFFFFLYGISFFRPRDSKRLVRILSFFVLVLKVSNNFTNNFTIFDSVFTSYCQRTSDLCIDWVNQNKYFYVSSVHRPWGTAIVG